MSVPKGHLMMLSLGPIQDFIHSARRCQDLWFGSWLLSDLASEVADAVHAMQAGVVVVFPTKADPLPGAEPPGVANILLAHLPEGVPPSLVAQRADARLRERLHAVRDWAWAGLEQHSSLFRRTVAEQQVDDLMELIWAAVPATGDYRGDRAAVVAALSAVKNTRLWPQPPWQPGAGTPKSSLDGARESVIDEAAYTTLSQRRRREIFGTKRGERLCGVGLLKRLGTLLSDDECAVFPHGRPMFHSTPHVAMSPTAERLQSHPDTVGRWIAALSEQGVDVSRYRLRGDGGGGPQGLVVGEGTHRGTYDGSLLMESRLAEALEDSGVDGPRAAGALPVLQSELGRVLKAGGGPSDPCPYYAFLLADGDNMGAAIDAIGTLQGHQKLGLALNAFALGCREIVESHRGTLIFAGGDDVLALLPLNRALECARALHDAFQEQVELAVARQIPAGPERPPTSLSVGIGIAHCREPMSEARALAQRAEATAKRIPGKNALCVLVDKRSGSELAVRGRWGSPRTSRDLARSLSDWVEVVRSGSLSAKFAHDLERIAAHYEPLAPEERKARAPEMWALFRQVLGRKRSVGGAAPAGEDAVDRILHRTHEEGPTDDPPAVLRQMADELQVAQLLARAHLDATGCDPEVSA